MSKRQEQGFEQPAPSEITPEQAYRGRRGFLAAAGVGAAAAVAAVVAQRANAVPADSAHPGKLPQLPATKDAALSTREALSLPRNGVDKCAPASARA